MDLTTEAVASSLNYPQEDSRLSRTLVQYCDSINRLRRVLMESVAYGIHINTDFGELLVEALVALSELESLAVVSFPKLVASRASLIELILVEERDLFELEELARSDPNDAEALLLERTLRFAIINDTVRQYEAVWDDAMLQHNQKSIDFVKTHSVALRSSLKNMQIIYKRHARSMKKSHGFDGWAQDWHLSVVFDGDTPDAEVLLNLDDSNLQCWGYDAYYEDEYFEDEYREDEDAASHSSDYVGFGFDVLSDCFGV